MGDLEVAVRPVEVDDESEAVGADRTEVPKPRRVAESMVCLLAAVQATSSQWATLRPVRLP